VDDLWAFVTQPHLVTLLGVFLLFLVICAHIAWFAERGNTEAISDHYYPGVFEALWFVWVSSTTVGYGDIAPKRWGGRLAASLIMLVGIAFAGILISELSSFRVTDRLQSKIHGPRDLADKPVATKADSSSVQVLDSLQAQTATYPTIEEAYDALAAKKVSAVVFDTPVIVHFAKNSGKRRKLAVAGPPFRRQSYGFAFPPESPWRERFNTALLGMIEDGSYQQLYSRYFTSD
jgi:polar amino acid transport system substrate-binding protein